MYGIGILCMIAVFLLTGIVIKSKYKFGILYILSIILLVYKTIEYTIYGLNLESSKIPIEYSTISYFIFSLTTLFKIKKMYSIASFLAFISGIGYLVAFSVVGDIFMDQQCVMITVIALVNHTILFIGSLIIISHYKIERSESKNIFIFTALYLFYVITMNLFFDFTKENIFIQMLLGVDFRYIDVGFLSHVYLLYFLILVIIYNMVMKLYFYVNQYLLMRGNKNYEHSI